MIELIKDKKSVNFNSSSGSVNFVKPSGGGGGDYYIPSIEDGFINFEPTQTTMPVVESIDIWDRLKIWNIDDGLECKSDNPYDFDLTQIEKGEKVALWLELSNYDVERYKGRNCGACLLMVDESKNFSLLLNFVNVAGMPFVCGFQQMDLEDGGIGSTHYLKAGDSHIRFTAESDGWYFGEFDNPENVVKLDNYNTSIYITDFENLKIVDIGSYQLEAAAEMYGVKIENVIDDFINSVICFCLPSGYNYKIPKIPNTKGIVINQTIGEGGEIGKGSITTEHLADNAVISSKIADGSITTGKIAVNAIGGSHIASKMIGSRHLDYNAVQTFAIKDGAVTPAKLDREYATKDDLANINLDNYVTKQEYAEDILYINSQFVEDIEYINDKVTQMEESIEEIEKNTNQHFGDIEKDFSDLQREVERESIAVNAALNETTTAIKKIPTVTAADNGKFLIVVDGAITPVSIPNVVEEEF